jgi:hypothetical protein
VDFPVNSSYQRVDQSTTLRVLAPSAGVNSNTRFLYVLPVQAGLPSSPNYNPSYGDGMSVARQLNLNDKYNVVVVAPSFHSTGPDPWYADNPTTASIRQEGYLVSQIIPFVDSLYPEAQAQRLLLGYSKSGWGALSLIFRHPDTFAAAAIWDAPLMMSSVVPAPYPGTDAVFGTDQYFIDNYRLDTHLSSYAGAFQSANRLWLGVNSGGNNFDPETRAFDQLLSDASVLHTLEVSDQTLAHSWESGWVPGAVAFLDGMAPAVVPEPTITLSLTLGLLCTWGWQVTRQRRLAFRASAP